MNWRLGTFRRQWLAALLAALAAVLSTTGCIVHQPPGHGRVLYLREASTGAAYHLYLPDAYQRGAADGRYFPLVMTFHGMKPFDTAGSQIREWQQEADRYGYVVCAPELATPTVTSPLPLNVMNGALRADEARILAIMDELPRLANVDPNTVLSTAWSYGGYIAHYMVNRHPERFSCLCVKQSNFSEAILDAQAVDEYRDRKIGIFYTENDLKLCREESSAAAQWYSRNGFDVTFAVFQALGHERRPSLAAWFFARTCGATPRTPPVELARMQVKELPPPAPQVVALATDHHVPIDLADRPTEVAAAAPPMFYDLPAQSDTPPAAAPLSDPPSDADAYADAGPMAQHTTALYTTPVAPPVEDRGSTPRPTPPRIRVPAEDNPVTIRLSSTIGISPLLISYSASIPSDLRDGASYLWTDNGEPLSNSPNGQRYLSDPGDHRLEVLVTTTDGRQFTAAQIVTVLERINKSTSN